MTGKCSHNSPANWRKRLWIGPKKSPAHKILPLPTKFCTENTLALPLYGSKEREKIKSRQQRETFLGIVHPVQHDLWSSPVASCYVTSHNLRSGSAQSEVEDLDFAIFAHANVTRFQVL